MNLPRICDQHPNSDSRRIDLVIGEKSLWGQGLGTDIICTLTHFGFAQEQADLIFGLVSDYNARSIHAFQKVGYQIIATVPTESPTKAKVDYDLCLTRAAWLAQQQRPR